jgi:hypothetical protein
MSSLLQNRIKQFVDNPSATNLIALLSAYDLEQERRTINAYSSDKPVELGNDVNTIGQTLRERKGSLPIRVAGLIRSIEHVSRHLPEDESWKEELDIPTHSYNYTDAHTSLHAYIAGVEKQLMTLGAKLTETIAGAVHMYRAVESVSTTEGKSYRMLFYQQYRERVYARLDSDPNRDLSEWKTLKYPYDAPGGPYDTRYETQMYVVDIGSSHALDEYSGATSLNTTRVKSRVVGATQPLEISGVVTVKPYSPGRVFASTLAIAADLVGFTLDKHRLSDAPEVITDIVHAFGGAMREVGSEGRFQLSNKEHSYQDGVYVITYNRKGESEPTQSEELKKDEIVSGSLSSWMTVNSGKFAVQEIQTRWKVRIFVDSSAQLPDDTITATRILDIALPTSSGAADSLWLDRYGQGSGNFGGPLFQGSGEQFLEISQSGTRIAIKSLGVWSTDALPPGFDSHVLL